MDSLFFSVVALLHMVGSGPYKRMRTYLKVWFLYSIYKFRINYTEG